MHEAEVALNIGDGVGCRVLACERGPFDRRGEIGGGLQGEPGEICGPTQDYVGSRLGNEERRRNLQAVQCAIAVGTTHCRGAVNRAARKHQPADGMSAVGVGAGDGVGGGKLIKCREARTVGVEAKDGPIAGIAAVQSGTVERVAEKEQAGLGVRSVGICLERAGQVAELVQDSKASSVGLDSKDRPSGIGAPAGGGSVQQPAR